MAKKSKKAGTAVADEPIIPEVVESHAPQSGADRVKATRIRGRIRAGAPVSPEDAIWLKNYDEVMDGRATARGASHARTVKYEESEQSAVGTGSAAEVAAAAAMSREEGRRYDHLLDGVIRGLTAATNMYKDMAETLLARAVEDGAVMRMLMVDARENYLARTELEANKIMDDAERAAEDVAKKDDGMSKMVEQFMPIIMAKLAQGGIK